MNVEVISVSSKGQIAIPVNFRKELDIKTGTRLAAYSDGENIILKPISLPSLESFRETLAEAQAYAKEEGITSDDITKAIEEYRREKREGKLN